MSESQNLTESLAPYLTNIPDILYNMDFYNVVDKPMLVRCVAINTYYTTVDVGEIADMDFQYVKVKCTLKQFFERKHHYAVKHYMAENGLEWTSILDECSAIGRHYCENCSSGWEWNAAEVIDIVSGTSRPFAKLNHKQG